MSSTLVELVKKEHEMLRAWFKRRRHRGLGRSASGRRGFTMPEVLVSSVVLGVVATGAMPLMNGLNSTLNDSSRITEGGRNGQELIEQLQTMPIDQLATTCTSFASTTMKNPIQDTRTYSRKCAIEDGPVTGSYNVTVTVKYAKTLVGTEPSTNPAYCENGTTFTTEAAKETCRCTYYYHCQVQRIVRFQ